jgi:hypothetical protein
MKISLKKVITPIFTVTKEEYLAMEKVNNLLSNMEISFKDEHYAMMGGFIDEDNLTTASNVLYDLVVKCEIKEEDEEEEEY